VDHFGIFNKKAPTFQYIKYKKVVPVGFELATWRIMALFQLGYIL